MVPLQTTLSFSCQLGPVSQAAGYVQTPTQRLHLNVLLTSLAHTQTTQGSSVTCGAPVPGDAAAFSQLLGADLGFILAPLFHNIQAVRKSYWSDWSEWPAA